MLDYPILSILIWLPILVGLILVASNDIGKSLSTTITLLTTLIILIISGAKYIILSNYLLLI